MTSMSGSRASRLILQSRSWPSGRCATATPKQPVFHLSCQHRCASSQTPSKTPSSRTSQDGDDDDAPISYLSSKAPDWSVGNSYGKHKKRPWYKVAPLSIALTIFMAWVFLRKETEIDRQLEIQLHERLPNLFEDPSKKGMKRDPVAGATVPEGGDEETPKE